MPSRFEGFQEFPPVVHGTTACAVFSKKPQQGTPRSCVAVRIGELPPFLRGAEAIETCKAGHIHQSQMGSVCGIA